jgi:hypothetical protein
VPGLPSTAATVTVTIGAAPALAQFNVVGATVEPVGVTGIHKAIQGNLSAYPNPASASVTVSLKNVSGMGTLRLIAADGREAARLNIHDMSQPIVVPLSALKAGLYSAVVNSGGNAQSTVRIQVAR